MVGVYTLAASRLDGIQSHTGGTVVCRWVEGGGGWGAGTGRPEWRGGGGNMPSML